MGRGFDEKELRRRAIDGVREEVEAFGSAAWTVWVPDEDRQSAELLAGRGHLLDAAPRAMALDMADLQAEPPAPLGIEPGSIEPLVAAGLNDRAYGYGEDGFRAGLAGSTTIRWYGAYADDEPVCCVGTIEAGDDCRVTGVATPPEFRGSGIASWLMLRALAEAREQGAFTASLQASKLGTPIYLRLGFADLGFIEMWELRR